MYVFWYIIKKKIHWSFCLTSHLLLPLLSIYNLNLCWYNIQKILNYFLIKIEKKSFNNPASVETCIEEKYYYLQCQFWSVLGAQAPRTCYIKISKSLDWSTFFSLSVKTAVQQHWPLVSLSESVLVANKVKNTKFEKTRGFTDRDHLHFDPKGKG